MSLAWEGPASDRDVPLYQQWPDDEDPANIPTTEPQPDGWMTDDPVPF